MCTYRSLGRAPVSSYPQLPSPAAGGETERTYTARGSAPDAEMKVRVFNRSVVPSALRRRAQPAQHRPVLLLLLHQQRNAPGLQLFVRWFRACLGKRSSFIQGQCQKQGRCFPTGDTSIRPSRGEIRISPRASGVATIDLHYIRTAADSFTKLFVLICNQSLSWQMLDFQSCSSQ